MPCLTIKQCKLIIMLLQISISESIWLERKTKAKCILDNIFHIFKIITSFQNEKFHVTFMPDFRNLENNNANEAEKDLIFLYKKQTISYF